MAIKTFTTGEVLTAADTNTYLANSGLVYITSSALGSGGVSIANCFSSTYNAYKIVVSNGSGSSASGITFQFASGVSGYNTGYQQILSYWSYATGANTTLPVNAGSSWTYFGEISPNMSAVNIDILDPYNAKYATFSGGYAGTVGGVVMGYHASTGQFTGFNLSWSGSATGGTCTVYGYRKA